MIAHGERFHVEKNVILTTNDDITVQQTFNYLCRNLDQFRVGAEFVVVCGVHGSPEGKLLEADEDFRYDYEAMFRWFHTEKRYKQCAPRNRKPFKMIEERQYQMGTVIEVSSEEEPNHEGKYSLDEKSKSELKNEFERVLGKNRPIVLILASCWSHNSEISNILRSTGLYSVIRMIEDKAELTAGRMFRLDDTQMEVIEKVKDDHTKNENPGSLGAKNVLLFGSHGTGKTILLTEIMLMRLAYYFKHRAAVGIHKIIASSFNSISDDYVLLRDLKETYFVDPIFERNFQFKNFKSLCEGKYLFSIIQALSLHYLQLCPHFYGNGYFHFSSIEFGVEFDWNFPLQTINSLIDRISIETQECKSILLLDEIVVKNDGGELNTGYDWSNLDLRPNVDVFLAVNPQGRDFTSKFQMMVPKKNDLRYWQLFGKHRNSYGISILLDHYKYIYESFNAYLDGSKDVIEESELPQGRQPVWIQKGRTTSHRDVLTFIKERFNLKSKVSLLYHDECIHFPEHFEFVPDWCKENNWNCLEAKGVAGSEAEFIITYDFPPGPEHISRARNGLIMVTTVG